MSNKNKKNQAAKATAPVANVEVAEMATVETVEATAPVETPVENVEAIAEVQNIVAEEAITALVDGDTTPAEVAAPVAEVVKKEKAKPNETTRTIPAFTEDTKGIVVGTVVDFLESNKPGAKTITGKVQRVFRFNDEKLNREEAKIKGNDGKRYYRFQTGMTVHVEPIAEAATTEEVPAEVISATIEG